MQLVSKEEQTRLGEAYRRRALIDNRYNRDGSDENTRYILQHFFKVSEDLVAADTRYDGKGALTSAQIAILLNSPSGLYYSIADKFASFVGTPKVDGSPVALGEAVMDLVATGYAVLTVEKKGEGYSIASSPASGATVESGYLRTIELYNHDGKTYAYVRSFLPGRNLHELFRLAQATSLQEADKVPLGTLAFLQGLPEEEDTGLSKPAGYLVHNGRAPHGQALFAICEPVIRSIERKNVMFETQFLQNVESFVVLKNINIPPNLIKPGPNGGPPKVNMASLGRIIMGNEQSGVEFVNNTNALIRDALDFTTRQTYSLSALTSIPEEFLGIEARDGAIGEGSRGLKHGAFMKKVEILRGRFEEAFAEISANLAASGMKDATGSASWDDVFAKTDTELVGELKAARDAGLLSRKRAVTLYLGGDEKMAEEEIAEIERENTATAPAA